MISLTYAHWSWSFLKQADKINKDNQFYFTVKIVTETDLVDAELYILKALDQVV